MTSPAVAVVTGASAGIGRATARALADRGYDVALIARGTDGLDAAADEVRARGRRTLVCPVDVAEATDVEDAAAAVERDLGPIDLWINNAMVSVFMPFAEMSADDFERVTKVTYLGYVHGTMAALRRMLPRDHGTIVQVGSALAYRSIPLQSAYCGAKHAIGGFTESLRVELMHRRSAVRVTTVNLPAINTPQFHWVKTTLPRHPQPVPPILQPEVAADAIVWAARRRLREVNLGAVTSLTILADKLLPGLLDRYLARTGVESQQADRPIEPDRPDNLWKPVPGDAGAHGEFDDRALRWSVTWWARKHRAALAIAAAACGAVVRAARR